LIPKEDQGGYKPSQITAPTATGIGVPGSQYSKDVANQSSPSDAGQTRKLDLGDGTFVWQRMDSVTGMWVNIGQPIPYQTNTAGEAVKTENYESVTTPNGTVVGFGNVSDPVIKYIAPVVLPTSDKLVTEQRNFIGAGGQGNVQVGLISTVKGYEYTPDIGRLSVMDKNRYIPAEVDIGGGITAQGYIDLETRMFDYAFKTVNVDWNRPGNPAYKPNYGSMKLYTDTGVVSGAVSTGSGLMFGVNIPDPRKIDLDTMKVEAQTTRAGLTIAPNAVQATEKVLKDIGNWYWNESGLSPLSPSYKPVEIGSNEWLLRVVPGASSELVGIRGVSLTADIIPRIPVLRETAVKIGEITAPAIKTASKTLEPVTNSVIFKSPGEASSNLIANLDYNALSFKSPGEYLTRTSEVAYKYTEASVNAPKSVADEFFRPNIDNTIPKSNDVVEASKLFDEGGYQYIGKGGVSDITITAPTKAPATEYINPLDRYGAYVVPNPESVSVKPVDMTMDFLPPKVQGNQGNWIETIRTPEVVTPGKAFQISERETPNVLGRIDDMDSYNAFMVSNPSVNPSKIDVINPATVRDFVPEETTMKIATMDGESFTSRGTVIPKINDELGFVDQPRREYTMARINNYSIGEFKPGRMKNYDSVNVGQIKLGKTVDVGTDNANIFMYADEKTAVGKYEYSMKMNKYNPKSFSSGLNVEETYKSVVNAARADVEMRSSIKAFAPRYSGEMAAIGVNSAMMRSELSSIKQVQDQEASSEYTFKPAIGVMTMQLSASVLKPVSETVAVASRDITAITQSTKNILDTDTSMKLGVISIRNISQGTKTTPIFDAPTITMPKLPSLNGKLPNYSMGIPPYMTGGGRSIFDMGRAFGKAYDINILNPFAANGGRKRKSGKAFKRRHR
jgi:hypothetical protein